MTARKADENNIQLIILYLPTNYAINGEGELVFAETDAEFEQFSALCAEKGIIAVSTKEEFLKMYQEEHVLPTGFTNTSYGAHANKYGHTAMANVLYETISGLEEQQ